MVTKDNNAGLLSKMAKFVRNPTKDWSDLDKPAQEHEQESGYSKQALKEIIERKRQNDFVRRREFDHLRKLRRNGPSMGPDPADRPSFFQSSIPSNGDDRAMTLRKIDEIEAQMSKQWWKGRQDDALGVADTASVVVSSPGVTTGVPALSGGSGESASAFSTTQGTEVGDGFRSGQGVDYEPTQMGHSQSPELMPSQQLRASDRPGSGQPDSAVGEFVTAKLFPIELDERLVDPELEEAAIRFANGDDVGAEAVLLPALQADNVDPQAADRWAAALFDLYRATGQQVSFDRVAIDYAIRFGRSAPAWFSTPGLLGHDALMPHVFGAAGSLKSRSPVWISPAELDLQAVQTLQVSLSSAPMPWHLNWGPLSAITPDAGKALAELFAQWCAQPVKLHFGGADVLEKVVRSCTPSGDKQVEVFWWQLRLDALRILRLQDEFELAALDYCVIYEVSPPPWEDAQCDFVHERAWAEGQSQPVSLDLPDETMSGTPMEQDQTTTAPMGLDAWPVAAAELTGEVLGDAVEALNQLQVGLKGADRLVISCARLIRVDFSAAGSILNWVAARESEGCHVQFLDVPCLVAEFFQVIGINEHARVVLRKT